MFKLQEKPPALIRKLPACQNFKFIHIFVWVIFALLGQYPAGKNHCGSTRILIQKTGLNENA